MRYFMHCRAQRADRPPRWRLRWSEVSSPRYPPLRNPHRLSPGRCPGASVRRRQHLAEGGGEQRKALAAARRCGYSAAAVLPIRLRARRRQRRLICPTFGHADGVLLARRRREAGRLHAASVFGLRRGGRRGSDRLAAVGHVHAGWVIDFD